VTVTAADPVVPMPLIVTVRLPLAVEYWTEVLD
jgi:hypothetical protein